VHEVQRCSRAHPAASGSGACLSIPAVCTREREYVECAHKHTHTYPPARAYERPRRAAATLFSAFSLHYAPDASKSDALHRSIDRDVNDRELRQGKGAQFDKWPIENNYRPAA